MKDPGSGTGPASMRPVVLLSMASFCAMATLRVVDPLLPEVAREFETTPGNASVIATTYALAYGIFQMVYGPLGDRYGKFVVIVTAMIAATAAVTVTALSSSLFALSCLRFVAGSATAAVIPLALAYIGDITPYEQRQPILARFMTGTVLGLLFGQVAGGIIMEITDWRSVFLVLGGLFALVTTLLVIELRSPRVHRSRPSATARPGRLLGQYFGLCRERHPRRVLIAVFLEGFLVYGGLTYLGAFLKLRFGLSYGIIGLMLAGFGIGGLLFTLVSRPVIRTLGESGMVRAGGTFVLAGYLVMAFLDDWRLAGPANFLIGFGFFLLHNTLQANATQMAPDARGSAVAFFAFALFMGQGAGVTLLGLVFDRIGYFPVFLFCGIGTLLLGFWFSQATLRAG